MTTMTDLPTIPSRTCPTCGGEPVMQCRCRRGDMKCGAGHEWHHEGDRVHLGPSDHGSPVCCSGEPVAIVDRGAVKMASMGETLADRVAARYKKKKTVKTQEGKDMTVYEYSDRQIANRNKAKAKKIEGLKKHIGELRATVKRDLRSDDPEKMLTALAVALMDHTFERVGNEESAKDGHVGVTGWAKKHISFGKKVTVKYVGKSGVKHTKEITDAGLKKALRDAYESVEGDDESILSWEGGKVTAEKVNAYLKDFDITAKDIRGFHANDTMHDALKAARKAGGKLPEEKKAREKQLKEEFKKALEETAEAVGHEAATLRSQYLVPGLEDEYLKDGQVTNTFVKSASLDERVIDRYLGAW